MDLFGALKILRGSRLRFGDERQIAAVDYIARVAEVAETIKRLALTEDELIGLFQWVRQKYLRKTDDHQKDLRASGNR